MNRFQIRRRVQEILRSDTYPAEAIHAAINRVIRSVNNLGRFPFHQNSEDITLADADYDYTVTASILAEELVVFQPGVEADQKIIRKGPTLTDAYAAGWFVKTGDAPNFYTRWNDLWLFDPIPNSTADSKTVRIFHYKDVDLLTGDLDVPTIPARYHETVLVLGAVAELAPNVQIRTTSGVLKAEQAFNNALKNLVTQEQWEPLTSYNLIRDLRWGGLHTVGHVSGVR